MFTATQISILTSPLRAGDPRVQKDYDNNPYMPTHEVIDTANAVFGHGQWDHEITELRLLEQTPLVKRRRDGGTYENLYVCYLARVRVTVRDEAGQVSVHEDVATGDAEAGIDKPPPHDMAAKGAVSGALKRALRVFGTQFGNSLYDQADKRGERAERMHTALSGATPPAAAPVPRPTVTESGRDDTLEPGSDPPSMGGPVSEPVDVWLVRMADAPNYDAARGIYKTICDEVAAGRLPRDAIANAGRHGQRLKNAGHWAG